MPEIHGAAEAKRAPKEVPVGDIPGREPASPREDWVPQPSAASAGSAVRQNGGTLMLDLEDVHGNLAAGRAGGFHAIALLVAQQGRAHGRLV